MPAVAPSLTSEPVCRREASPSVRGIVERDPVAIPATENDAHAATSRAGARQMHIVFLAMCAWGGAWWAYGSEGMKPRAADAAKRRAVKEAPLRRLPRSRPEARQPASVAASRAQLPQAAAHTPMLVFRMNNVRQARTLPRDRQRLQEQIPRHRSSTQPSTMHTSAVVVGSSRQQVVKAYVQQRAE